MNLPRGHGYSGTLESFLETETDTILGQLTAHAATRQRWGSTEHQQVAAWRESLEWLTSAAHVVRQDRPSAGTWTLCLEYEIPRRGGRIDAVLLADDLIFVIEFKSSQADGAARRQAEDYALELLDLHEQSEGRALFRTCRVKDLVQSFSGDDGEVVEAPQQGILDTSRQRHGGKVDQRKSWS